MSKNGERVEKDLIKYLGSKLLKGLKVTYKYLNLSSTQVWQLCQLLKTLLSVTKTNMQIH